MLHGANANRTLAAIGGLVLILAACGGATSSIEAPSASPSAAAPTAQPTPQLDFVLPEGALPATAWATVSNGPLDLYAWPWLESGSSGYLDETAELLLGQTVVIDGEAWTEINGGGGGGWAPHASLAASVKLKPVTCPAESDLWTLVGMSPWELLSCLGGRELTLEGSEAVGSDAVLTSGDPAWLNGVGELAVTPDGGTHSLDVHVAPGSVGLDRPAFETDVAPYRLSLTGHFNDPASSDCRGTSIPLGDGPDQRLALLDATAEELACREQFVLTGLTVLPAKPSPAPSDSTALLRVDRGTDLSTPFGIPTLVVFGDGRLVMADANTSRWTERRLTSAAQDELLAFALGEDLLKSSASYPPPPGHAAGFGYVSIRILRDAGPVTVSATNASREPAASAVIALGEELIARADALPDSAFTDDVHAWMPTAYDLEVSLSPGVLDTYPSPPAFILWAEDARLPLPTPLVETGPVLYEEGGMTVRCSVLDPLAASKLRAAFYAAGYRRYDGGLITASFDLGSRDTNGFVEVRIQAAPPDEAADYYCRPPGA